VSAIDLAMLQPAGPAPIMTTSYSDESGNIKFIYTVEIFIN